MFLHVLLMFIALDTIISAFPLAMYYKGFNENTIGLLISLFGITVISWRMLLTRVADRHGPVRVVLLACLVNIVIPLFYHYVDSIPGIIIVRIVHALSPAGFMFAGQMLLLKTVAEERTGKAVSLFGVASALSLLIAPALSIELVTRFEGYFYPSWVSIMVSIAALIILYWGDFLGVEKNNSCNSARTETNKGVKGKGRREKKAIIPVLFYFVFAFCYIGLISFVTIYAKESGLKYPGLYFTILAASSIFIRVICGSIMDKKTNLLLLRLGIVITAISCFLLIFINMLVYLISAFLIGIGLGVVQTILLTLLVRVFPDKSSNSTANFASAFDSGIVLGSLTAGLIINSISYEALFVFFSGILLLTAFISRPALNYCFKIGD